MEPLFVAAKIIGLPGKNDRQRSYSKLLDCDHSSTVALATRE